jgi:uncharacterized protein (TIGR03086 family)
MSTDAPSPNPAELLAAVTDRVKEVVGSVQQSQLSDPTPCAEWNVHGLINHLIGGVEYAAGCLVGNPPNIQLTGADSTHVNDHDPSILSLAYRTEVDRVLELASQPGTLEKITTTPFGEIPFGQFLVGTLMDQFIHGWDLAKATGQDTTLDTDLVEFAFPLLASGFADMGRESGFIGMAIDVPDDASLQDQMIAYMGRQP